MSVALTRLRCSYPLVERTALLSTLSLYGGHAGKYFRYLSAYVPRRKQTEVEKKISAVAVQLGTNTRKEAKGGNNKD
jgi:hypothetical protein